MAASIQQQRRDDRRAQKKRDFDDALEDGRMTVRKMTPEEMVQAASDRDARRAEVAADRRSR